uniref:Uncharacterized protein n=1 Tax=Haptolina brevifila TaxID=156173 RepID=A0A7S2DA93_9EUKA|mmetsp:Transcript_35374/g.70501  ORF Transcript_35374/g.70501 Transcript_35374/m.70501 type:complete len:137 (+) Transcript_35374:316-726(+)
MLRWLRIRLNQIRSDQIRSDSLLWPCLLLQAFPDGAKAADAQGNLPLHTAARSSFKTPELVELILAAYPDAVTMENSAGKLPHDLDRSYGAGKKSAFLKEQWAAAVGPEAAAAAEATEAARRKEEEEKEDSALDMF